jgi:hypothetical protein
MTGRLQALEIWPGHQPSIVPEGGCGLFHIRVIDRGEDSGQSCSDLLSTELETKTRSRSRSVLRAQGRQASNKHRAIRLEAFVLNEEQTASLQIRILVPIIISTSQDSRVVDLRFGRWFHMGTDMGKCP